MNSTVKNVLFVVAVLAGVKIAKSVLSSTAPGVAALADKVI